MEMISIYRGAVRRAKKFANFNEETHIVKRQHKPMFDEYNRLEFLLNKDNILDAIEECVEKRDLEHVIETIGMYRKALRRTKHCQESDNNKKAPSGEPFSYSDAGNVRPVFSARQPKRTSKKIA